MERSAVAAIEFGLALLIASAGAACARGAQPAFDLRQVAPGVFVHLGRQLAPDGPGHADIANIGFIVGKRCIAVIDTGGSVGTGRALRAAIRERSQLPICYVVNTHVHYDHVLGNAAFAGDRPEFVGHAALADAIVRSRSFFLQHFAADLGAPAAADSIIGPSRLVMIGHPLELDLGDRRLRLRAWPRAHTDCDLTVLDELTGTLWTGDLLFRGRVPVLDGSVLGWLAAIEELATIKNVRLVVPGHGALTDDLAAALAPERSYLEALVDGVRRGLAQGESLQDEMRAVGAAQRSRWLLFDGVNPQNVERVYLELEWQ